jgi:hypothetical protein
MAGSIPLFQRDADGLLHQIASDEAAQLRAQETPVTHINLVIELLIPAEELEARAAEEKANREKAEAAALARKAQRDAALAKMQSLGLTEQDLAALLL